MCLSKPEELLELYAESDELFLVVQHGFDVPRQHCLDLSSVDRDQTEATAATNVAALTMHYTQSLRLLAARGVRVRIANVVNTCACLHSTLSALADSCELPRLAGRLIESRDRIGVAAAAVAAVDIANGSGHKYMS